MPRHFGPAHLGGYHFAALAIVGSLGIAGSAWGQSGSKAAKELPPGGEEIIITHERLGPLSDWAAMQQHSADYNRLKAKFDPTVGSSHVDSWNSDRGLSQATPTGGAFADESANAPTPSGIRAAEDAIVPP